ncbi:M20/M25/M40 family metallo-hydrolase [Paenibacillus amylolyticus]|nr:M20/M25/M40 family metallo-hydrolase [Paenibacillus amylolyticus]
MNESGVYRSSGTNNAPLTLPDVEQVELQAMLDWLSTYGADAQGGVTRLLYDSAWCEAQGALAAKMQEKGLSPEFDQSGNLYGTLKSEGKESANGAEELPIVIGSHIDTVVYGGKYDGAYGVVAGVLAFGVFAEAFWSTRSEHFKWYPYVREEGSRFPFAYWGSRSITGMTALQDVEHLKDQDGVTFAQTIHDAGFGPDSVYRPTAKKYGAFIELHIEQGQVLERLGHSIGVVSDIVGQKRFSITVSGEANHAGNDAYVLAQRRTCRSSRDDYCSKKYRIGSRRTAGSNGWANHSRSRCWECGCSTGGVFIGYPPYPAGEY